MACSVAACGNSTHETSGASSAARAAGAGYERDLVTTSSAIHRPAAHTGGGTANDDNPSNADSGEMQLAGHSDPCTLVSRAQADAILGGRLSSVEEAPLGPTCIYQAQGSAIPVTLAVESLDFATIKAHIHHRRGVTIAGSVAYCGELGQPALFAPLTGGRMLRVTGRCAVAAKFAALALPHLLHA